MIASAGLIPGTSYFALQAETADHEKASQLHVAPGTSLITMERVRTADGHPVVYSLDTLTESLFHRAEIDPQLLRTQSIYDILQTSLGKVIEYGIARPSYLLQRLIM